MDDEDDYPNFGLAYPPTQPKITAMEEPVASEPASKVNNTHHARNESLDDDFYARYPAPTPERKQWREVKPKKHEHGTTEKEESPGVSPLTSPLAREHIVADDVDQEVDLLDSNDVEEKVDVVDKALPEAPQQGQADGEIERDADSVEEPSTHYEHQSAITELEEAIDESVEAPLLSDEQALPTVATMNHEPTPTTETESQPTKRIERSFTTNFTDIPATESVTTKEVQVSSDWPAVGDDKTFAELLDDKDSAQDTKKADNEDAVHTDGLADGEQELNAAWAAALDDDDILEDPTEIDPTTFFGDDDHDGFLEDEPAEPVALPARNLQQQRSVSAYTPSSQIALEPHRAPFLDQAHGRAGGTPSTGLSDLYSQPAPMSVSNQQARPTLSSAQSFVDKKSGYQSPYDLPMDVIKPRRRPATSAQTSQASMPRPPPRTSSYGVSGVSLPQEQIADPSPPASSHGLPDGSVTSDSVLLPPSTTRTPQADAGFFEELPMTMKPRLRSHGTYTAQSTGMATPPLSSTQPHFPPRQASPLHAPPTRSSQTYEPIASQPQQPSPAIVGGLRQPDKAPLFPEQVSPPSTMQSQLSPSPPTALAQAANRYSPSPQGVPQIGGNVARYSPAPPGQPMKSAQRYSSSPNAAPSLSSSRAPQSFVPRTSSPLAVHGRPQMQAESHVEQLRNIPFLPGSPGKASDLGLHDERRGSGTSRYAPSIASTAGESASSEAKMFSPQRQRTQSPSEFRRLPALAQTPSTSVLTSSNHLVNQTTGKMHLAHRRQFSRDLPFAIPTDERAQDSLQRWKGHPIFYWSGTGMITSSFPRQTPFYSSGASGPNIKCTPGDIKLMDASKILPLTERDARFPGPLTARSKSKKKDLLAWLTAKVEEVQQVVEAAKLNFDLPDKDRCSHEEKLLLWRVMRLYLEHDGVLEGSPKIEEQVRQLLVPDLAQKGQIMDIQSPILATIAGDVVDRTVIHQIRQALLEGQRERAVWLAEEKRLWGHAMLIASTMSPDTFKQIVASFVRSQIKDQGGSELKSLAALYQVFAGSPDDCVDELVPPSARAGFQMINTADGRGTAHTLSGLDQWRETLSLVHSNPTPGNSASLVAVGKLLAGYGRTEAAHICYLFARSLAKHSGADDPESHFVLLGVDVSNGIVDLDSLMLTEIYEYASSLAAPSTAAAYIPHLQAYKLVHARYLAASGHKAQAQSYCEHIDAAIRATTRPSGYYHQTFAQDLRSLNELLSQTPHTSAHGAKFFSRPAIDKVSSNMGSWFTKFVSGSEEAETDSNTSGQAANDADTFGPFGGVTGGSGPISRTPSSAELSMSTVPLTHAFQPSSLPKRYTPSSQGSVNKYAPSGTQQVAASRTSIDSDQAHVTQPPSSMPSSEPLRSASSRYAPVTSGQSPALLAVQPNVISRRISNQSLASNGSYEPRPLLAEHDGFGSAPPEAEADAIPAMESLVSGVSHEETSEPVYDAEDAGGYAPPTMGYEPPSYQPYEPELEPDDGPETQQEKENKKKKKSFMDDDGDDDMASGVAALQSQPKSRGPDPAVVAAAAADAARDGKGHGSKESGSWFGGWFGKKDPNAAPGPIKAKLGEESSFYFDKDLNKWVNKKGGVDATSASAPTPPPPRAPPGSGGIASGPPSRAASGTGPPISGPPSRQSTPANGSLPPKAIPTPALSGLAAGAMAPPPRPSSSMSTASSLDDLLGGPAGAGKKSAARNKKKGRYVDVMANAS